MGTWALHSFGNDDAGDLIGDLVEGTDLSPVREAIERVQSTAGYLEASEAQQGIAACEVIALVLGHPSVAAQAEEELATWVARVRPSLDVGVVSQAVQVVDRVLAPDSELRELWEESDEFKSWQADVTALRARLQAEHLSPADTLSAPLILGVGHQSERTREHIKRHPESKPHLPVSSHQSGIPLLRWRRMGHSFSMA